MLIRENVDLRPFNTFGTSATARYFCTVESVQAFQNLISSDIYQKNKVLILGGGSNVLFKNDFDGLVIKNEVLGKKILSQTDTKVSLQVGSGESWHALVMYCVENNWGGIENLSLIPGTTGAAPIQNIGAYGVEVKDVIEKVEGIDMTSGQHQTYTRDECRFGYRESVFKHALREKNFISSVTLTLTQKNHLLSVGYGAIQDTLKTMHVTTPTIESIRDAVIHIRRSKLPDPNTIGNAGSFFKNPVINMEQYGSLKKEYPSMPSYISENQSVKVPAGWLIEQCGWKGFRTNDAGVHLQQALVLVNYGNANGEEIFQLAEKILLSVQKKFGINLSLEVNII